MKKIPGKNEAVASLVLGLISVGCWFFGYSSILSVILGIIGLALASSSKKYGYQDSIRTAGFVLSLIGRNRRSLCLSRLHRLRRNDRSYRYAPLNCSREQIPTGFPQNL